MDAFQGRLDTAGALIQKGGKPESAVLPALPVTALLAPALPENDGQVQAVTPGQRAALIAELGEELKDALCEGYSAVLSGEQEYLAYRLSNEKLLVATRCQGTRYQQDAIVSSHKLGAMGDCVAHEEKTRDGAYFLLTSASTTGMCRRIGPSGAWTLSTVVIEVRRR